MATLKEDPGKKTKRSQSRPQSVKTFASAPDDFHNGSEWAGTVKDPWDPCILTLDGGGIRGYSSLLMVQQLMHEIAKWETRLEMEEAAADAERRMSGTSTPPFEPRIFNENELLPCHYFDFMYGTSTGGLIATMLGRLRMSTPQCLDLYRKVGDDLFGKRRSRLPLITKYHHKPLESAVKEIVRRHCKNHPNGECDGNDWFPFNVDEEDPVSSLVLQPAERLCQTICLTATHNQRVNEAHLLRTYDHRYINVPNYITLYNEGADKLHIWEVTRATSAAPFYFKILEADIHGEIMGFKDGGIRENNPAGAAWSEFVSLYGEHRDPALLLSIGTGRPDETRDGFATAWPGPLGTSDLMKKMAEKFAVFKNLLIKYTEGEEQHRAMVRIAKGENTWYKRLNVDTGLEKMKLDNWERGFWAGPEAFAKPEPQRPRSGPPNTPGHIVPGGATLTRMEAATREYLARPYDHKFDTYAPPMRKVEQAAEKLVRQRRARERSARGEADPTRRWDTFVGRWLTGRFDEEDEGVVRWDV
ncbi:acyl transferase/acyl hydrolase/lysophospholipase [Phyllosticta citriasiana]|uniref:acyl transferase/acyl hydrolase/lysophospholipase n=1 Tax=Phyllosticta citriasiana TaxID=595635 RepID=UPI0030FDED39